LKSENGKARRLPPSQRIKSLRKERGERAASGFHRRGKKNSLSYVGSRKYPAKNTGWGKSLGGEGGRRGEKDLAPTAAERVKARSIDWRKTQKRAERGKKSNLIGGGRKEGKETCGGERTLVRTENPRNPMKTKLRRKIPINRDTLRGRGKLKKEKEDRSYHKEVTNAGIFKKMPPACKVLWMFQNMTGRRRRRRGAKCSRKEKGVAHPSSDS